MTSFPIFISFLQAVCKGWSPTCQSWFLIWYSVCLIKRHWFDPSLAGLWAAMHTGLLASPPTPTSNRSWLNCSNGYLTATNASKRPPAGEHFAILYDGHVLSEISFYPSINSFNLWPSLFLPQCLCYPWRGGLHWAGAVPCLYFGHVGLCFQ